MNELFLGLIAAAVVVMAVVQVVVVIVTTRAARNIGQAVSRLEQDVRPIVANLQAMSGDAARDMRRIRTGLSDGHNGA